MATVDVIVPHRLAKNTASSREYILPRLSDPERASFIPHSEDVADLGQISLGHRDLAMLRPGRSSGAPGAAVSDEVHPAV